MLLVQPPGIGIGTGPRLGVPLCFDYADFEDSEIGYRVQHQHQHQQHQYQHQHQYQQQRHRQWERERYYDENDHQQQRGSRVLNAGLELNIDTNNNANAKGKGKTPVIVSATMSVVGFGGGGGGCLGFGHGFGGGDGGGGGGARADCTGCVNLGLGRRGSLPLAAEFPVGTAPPSPSPLASSFFPRERGRTEDEHQHQHEDGHQTNTTPTRGQSAPLALFARIRKQLSGASVGERRASSDGYVSGWKEGGRDEKERRGSGMTAAMTMMAAMYVGAEGGEGEVFSTTTKPKPGSASQSSSVSAKRNQRRRRQRKQQKEQGSGEDTQHDPDAVFSSPSVYSCSSASQRSSSFIGSSASFLELEREENSKGSRDHGEFMKHPRAHLPLQKDLDHEDSGYGRSYYYDNTNTNTNDDITSTYTANTDRTQSSAGSYVPYLPLIIQHERLQAKLQVPLSLDAVSEVVSGSASASVLSRESKSCRSASGSSKASGRHNVDSVSMPSGSRSREKESQKGGGGKQRSRTSRKGDVPLPPSSVAAPRSTPSVSPLRSAHASNSQHRGMRAGMPPSPTSPTSPTSSEDTSASTRSPITPKAPVFFATLAADGVKLEDTVDVDPRRDSRRKGVHDLEHHHHNQPSTPVFVHSRSKQRPGDEEKQQSILVHKDVNVNVLPPTPTTLNGFRSDDSQQRSSSTVSLSPSSPPSPSSLQSQSHSPLSRARSRSRQNLGKAPPPPSGPLPLPPQSPSPSPNQARTGTERTNPKAPSPQPSFELGFPTTHRHPSPFEFHSEKGSMDTTATMSTMKKMKTKAKATMSMTMTKGHGAGKEVFADTGSEMRFVVVDKEDEDGDDEVDVMILRPLYTSELDEAPSAHAYSYQHSHVSSESTSVVVPDAPKIEIEVFALHEERLKKAAETEKIGVGRQQIQQSRKRQRHSGCRDQEQPQVEVQAQELEWTLCLGADASAPPVPSSAAIPSSCIIPEVTVTLSPSSSPLLPLPSSPTPSPLSPYKEPSATQMRVRTKSESALGHKTRGAASVQDWTLMLPLPPHPFLPTQLKPAASTMSLPFSPLSSASPSPSSSKITAGTAKERYSDPTPLGGLFEDDTSSVNFSTDLHIPSASVDSHARAQMVPVLDGPQDDRMLCVPADADVVDGGARRTPNQVVEEIVLCVPRVVTQGSGSRSMKTRSKASLRSLVIPSGILTERERQRGYKPKSKPKLKDRAAARVAFDVDADADGNDDDDKTQPNRNRKRSSNLVKLDALSADLARFNEMLRSASASASGSGGVGGHFHHHSISSIDSGFLHGAPGVGGAGVVYGSVNVNVDGGAKSKPNADATVPVGAKRQQQQLKHTRSHGILEVDEPPPPHAILRVPSLGDLFLGEGDGGASPRARARTDSKARVKTGKGKEKEVVEFDSVKKEDQSVMTPEGKEEDAPTRERVSMGSIISASSSSSVSSAHSDPFLTPTSASPSSSPSPALVMAPPKRASAQSFASLTSNSRRSSKTSLSSLSSTASTPTKIRPPLPFAPSPSVFGGYAAVQRATSCSMGICRNVGAGVGLNTNANTTSRKLSTTSLDSTSLSTSSPTTAHTPCMGKDDEKGLSVRSSASTGLLRNGTTGTGTGTGGEKGSMKGRARSLSLRVVVDSMKQVDGSEVVVVGGGEECEVGVDDEAGEEGEGDAEVEAEKEAEVKAILSSSSSSSSSGATPTPTQPQIITTNSSPTPALRVDTSSLPLVSFPSNSTLRPTSSSSSGSGSGSSTKSSRSSGSLTPTASRKPQFKKSQYEHMHRPMQLSPEEVEVDYYESESAGPTPLASSFPVPPAFPTLPSSLAISMTNANAKTTLIPKPISEVQRVDANMNGNLNEHARLGPAAVKYHAPGTGDSTHSSRTIMPLQHFQGLSLEERIRQLRVLGVDAAGEKKMEREGNVDVPAVATAEKEKDSDGDESLCSESYYSARSSFSSERDGVR